MAAMGLLASTIEFARWTYIGATRGVLAAGQPDGLPYSDRRFIRVDTRGRKSRRLTRMRVSLLFTSGPAAD